MPDRPRDSSYWNATATAPDFPRLSGEIETDIAVVGGGIVGLTAARRLKDLGLRVAVLEGRRVGRQVTGRSTAKVTSQHGTIYQTLEETFDEDRALIYAQAQEEGLHVIRALVRDHGIDCDLEECAAYVYVRDGGDVARIEKEAEVCARLGLPASLVREVDLPFEVRAALRFDGQAQFHPTKYLAALARTVAGDGCHVFEHSRVVEWEPRRVATRGGAVRARHVVMATHLPLGQVGGYYARAHPSAEPVVAARVGRVPDGMYYDMAEPHHSIRTHRRADGATYAIVTGAPFRPGHTDDERRSFAEIERWLAAHFDAGPVEHAWVNEDYTSVDGAPFIGWSTSGGEGYLVATGFGAWGITGGTAAGMMLADLAADNGSPWLDLFDAGRIEIMAGGSRFLRENVEVATHLARGYLSRRLRSYDELAPGEAAILRVGGEDVAAFRDGDGNLYAVAAACTHMSCVLGWNETDRTWDCPCHGSRFALDGEVVHGPAVEPLAVKEKV